MPPEMGKAVGYWVAVLRLRRAKVRLDLPRRTQRSLSLLTYIRQGFKTHYFDAGKARFSDDTAFTKDTVCFIASMTKLVTSVATMQVVERGLIGLDDVLSDMVPSLRNLQVLQSFDDGGNPVLVKSKNPMTLR